MPNTAFMGLPSVLLSLLRLCKPHFTSAATYFRECSLSLFSNQRKRQFLPPLTWKYCDVISASRHPKVVMISFVLDTLDRITNEAQYETMWISQVPNPPHQPVVQWGLALQPGAVSDALKIHQRRYWRCEWDNPSKRRRMSEARKQAPPRGH